MIIMLKFFIWFCWILLQDVLENIEKENPSLFQLIQDHRADFFIRLLLEKPRELQDDDVLHFQSNEPNNGGDRYKT